MTPKNSEVDRRIALPGAIKIPLQMHTTEFANPTGCTSRRSPADVSAAAWPGTTYNRVRPTWIRYSDFGHDPAQIVEFDLAALGRADGPGSA
jgi:hypothetical protein